MANGIGSVWAANFGEDGKPNGVGSVWIANASALSPSGGASEEQINELSAAIDYVSANAGDPNALTGYQDDCIISATTSYFKVSGGYNLSVGNNATLSSYNGGSLIVGNGARVEIQNAANISATNSNVVLSNALVSATGNEYNEGILLSSNSNDLELASVGHLKVSNNSKVSITMGANLNVANGAGLSSINGSRVTFDAGSYINSNALKLTGNFTTANLNGAGISAVTGTTSAVYSFGGNLQNGARRFISADGGVSAWQDDMMITLGQYNKTTADAAFVIGNGGSFSRNDLFVIDYSGNAKSNDFVANNGAKLSDLTAMSAAIGDVESLLSSL